MSDAQNPLREQLAKEFPKLRQNFRRLLISNANYFGNLEGTVLQPVFPIKGSTAYERLGCIGFQPELNMLKAVVYVNQETGYGTGLCGPGTEEYVRFFLSYDNGITWQDQGLTSFKVHNVDHNSRLEFAVEKKISPPRRLCRFENLIKVRAILSWEVPPPPNPNWIPVWGNRAEATIQVDPLRLVKLPDLVKIDPEILALLEPNQLLKVQKLDLPIEATAKAYKEAKISPARALHHLVQEVQANPAALSDPSISASANLAAFAKVYGVDLASVIDQIINSGDGNQEFEQLTCIGMQPGTFLDQLVGVINVKKSSGYSGSLCTKGSREYIAYYMDFGGGWQYMGTASVGVNDIAGMPADGLKYTAYLPVDLTKYRQRCVKPVLAKMRAILSWSTPPPIDPDYKPVWGGREDTVVVLTPREGDGSGALTPFITAAGRVSVEKINSSTGLATATSPFTVNEAPFGGEVQISGYILNHPNYSAGAAKLRYKVMISSDGVNYSPAANDFTISVDRWVGPVVTQFDINQKVDSDGFYSYQEDAFGPDYTFVDEDVLFRFYTAPMNGPRWVRMDVEDPNTLLIIQSNAAKLMIDNTAPSLTFTMDQTPCSDITVGAVITGTFSATDAHMGDVAISVSPAGTVTKLYTVSNLVQKTGTWKVETTGLSKCGYVVQAWAADRAIVNNYPSGNQTGVQSIGFCLR